MWPIFQGKTCMARNDTTEASQCTLGSFPEYVVNVTSAAQVQLAVNFARNLNIRLVIKNTGHEYVVLEFSAHSHSPFPVILANQLVQAHLAYGFTT